MRLDIRVMISGVNEDGFRSPGPGCAVLAVAMASALVAAQLIVMDHAFADHDHDHGHDAGGTCEYCVAGANLVGANVHVVKPVAQRTVSVRAPDSVIRRATPVTFRKSRFARAPPAAS